MGCSCPHAYVYFILVFFFNLESLRVSQLKANSILRNKLLINQPLSEMLLHLPRNPKKQDLIGKGTGRMCENSDRK